MALAAALGCQKAEQIRSYPAPKVAAPPAPTDRMLAAILPDGSRAWFFKVVGPTAAIDKHAKQISDFLSSVRPAGDRPLPSWKLPAGWKEQPGNAMRAATIVIPAEQPLELTVTTLGWRGTPDDMLNNVNRWRGQMQLPQISEEELADTSRQLKAGDATMTMVDLRGRFQSGMAAPFAGGGPFIGGSDATSGPPAAPPTSVGALPAGHPPIEAGDSGHADAPRATDAAAGSDSTLPKFDVPPSWQPAPNSEFSRAVYTVRDGTRTARFTISEFSANAGPMMTDPLSHVNRWRGELGLSPIDKAALTSVTKPMLVDGQTAIYMPAIPDVAKPEESHAAEATLAAMVPEGDRVWFFKLKGDRALVEAEREKFESLLKSVRFTTGGGASDGN